MENEKNITENKILKKNVDKLTIKVVERKENATTRNSKRGFKTTFKRDKTAEVKV